MCDFVVYREFYSRKVYFRRSVFMPIPAYLPKDEDAVGQCRSDNADAAAKEKNNVLQFPGSNNWVVNQAPEYFLATTHERMWAHSIDAILLHGLSLYAAKWISVVFALFYSTEIRAAGSGASYFFLDSLSFTMPKIWFFSFCFFSFLYVVIFHSWQGRSLGKILLGLRVIDEKGEKPSLRSSILRYFAYALSYASCGVGFFLGYHDDFSATKVVREK